MLSLSLSLSLSLHHHHHHSVSKFERNIKNPKSGGVALLALQRHSSLPVAITEALIKTFVLLKPDIHCLCKKCRSRSVCFWRMMILICTVYHSVCEFTSTIWIKDSDWLTIRSGRVILIYSAWQGLSYLSRKVRKRCAPRGDSDQPLHSIIFTKRGCTSWSESSLSIHVSR